MYRIIEEIKQNYRERLIAIEILCRFKQKRQRDWQSKTCEKIERGKNGEFNFKQSKTMVY